MSNILATTMQHDLASTQIWLIPEDLKHGTVACTERKKVEHSKVRVDLSTSTFIFSIRLKVDLNSTFFRLSSTFIFFVRLFFVSTFIDFNRLFHQKSKSRSKIVIFCNPGVLVAGAKCSAVKSHSNSCTCSCFADTISRLL
jgi:hypothetical protein